MDRTPFESGLQTSTIIKTLTFDENFIDLRIRGESSCLRRKNYYTQRTGFNHSSRETLDYDSRRLIVCLIITLFLCILQIF